MKNLPYLAAVLPKKSYMNKHSKIILLLCAILPLLGLTGCRCSIFEGGRRPEVLPDPACGVIDYDCDCEVWSDSCPETTNARPNTEANDEHERYRFARGDVLEVSLMGEEEDIVDNAVVAPDGNLYYAFLEGVAATGRTTKDVEDEMQDKMKKFYLNPSVTIVPQVATMQMFKIFGRVRRPGIYPMNSEIHLREAIAIAGDLMTEYYEDKGSNSDLYPLADLQRSYLLRDGHKVDVDFTRLLYDPSYKDNILVRAGDFIYIAPAETSQVYILGAVRAPGRVIWKRDLTFMNLMSTAGGWGYGSPLGANLKSVLLIRGPLCNPCAMCIDVTRILDGSARDFLLQPGDILYVHNQTLRFGRYLLRVAINSFLQSFATGAGSYYAIQWMPFSSSSAGDPALVEVP
jgi:polysaccharide export outer membrane protein